MKTSSIFSLTAALMMTANLHAQSSYTVTVNPNICYQTIADFGSSDCGQPILWANISVMQKKRNRQNGSSARKWMPMVTQKASVSQCGA